MRKLLLFAAAAFAGATPAAADTVCEWMEFSQNIITAAAPPATAPRTPDHDRAATQVALAMFEALNAIDRRYESYLKFPAGDPRASQDVAAATAAYQVLTAHFPGQKPRSTKITRSRWRRKRMPRRAMRARLIGEAAAKAALATGGIDPNIVQTPYMPRAQAGVWVPVALPVFEPFSTAFTPWILPRADAARPGPPPPLTSERYARDYDEVKRLGSRTSKERTPDETLMARYRITPNMMPTMRLIADAKGRQPGRQCAVVRAVGDGSRRYVHGARRGQAPL